MTVSGTVGGRWRTVQCIQWARLAVASALQARTCSQVHEFTVACRSLVSLQTFRLSSCIFCANFSQKSVKMAVSLNTADMACASTYIQKHIGVPCNYEVA